MGSFFVMPLSSEKQIGEKYIITKKYIDDEYRARKSMDNEWLIQVHGIDLETDRILVQFLSGGTSHLHKFKYIKPSHYIFDKQKN